MKKETYVVEILVEKAEQDLLKLKTEAKQRGLETQLPRWISNYFLSLQKTSKEAYEIVLEKFENGEV